MEQVKRFLLNSFTKLSDIVALAPDSGYTVVMSQADPQQIKSGTFLGDAESVLQRIRTTLTAIVTELPPRGSLRKAADLQQALKLDKKLSWKLSKVISADDPLAAAAHVPGPANLTHFLRAAANRGVADALIDAAAKAGADFQQVVETHAGDRTAFDSMISSIVDSAEASQILLQQRRTVFRGQRLLFGVFTKIHLRTIICQPTDDPDNLSSAQLNGYIGLRRMRMNAPLALSRTMVVDDAGTVLDFHREPIDPTADGQTGFTLLRPFCSQPLPSYRVTTPAPGVQCTELFNAEVGELGAITCVEGHIDRGPVARYRSESERQQSICVPIRMPTETLIIDMLLREDTYGRVSPVVDTVADRLLPGVYPHLIDHSLHLDARESVAYLGRGTSVLPTPEYAEYAKLGEYVFDRLGWDAERFDVYRCRIEYPILPSTIVVKFPLPERP